MDHFPFLDSPIRLKLPTVNVGDLWIYLDILFSWPLNLSTQRQALGIGVDNFEDIVQNPARIEQSRASDRWIAFGYDASGEWTACVYELDDDQTTVFPITAYRPGA